MKPYAHRHSWNKPHLRAGDSDRCQKCGCQVRKKRDPESLYFTIQFRPQGADKWLPGRPPCPPPIPG